jgi:hypothetical protein
MAELPKQPQRGDDILTAFNRLRDFVRKERLLSVVGGQLKSTDAGKTLSIPRSSNINRVIAFGCSAAGLDITVKAGLVLFKGVSKSYTITNPITIAATSYGYFSIDLTNGTPTWTVSTSDPGNGDDDTEIWRVFVATVTGTGATAKITELLECQHGDIHCMGNA